MTKAPSTLEELVAPMGKRDFLIALHQRKLTFLRGSDPHRFRPLLDWDALVGQFQRGEYPRGLADVRVVKESTTVHPEHWLTKNPATSRNRVDLTKVEGFMAEGHSLVVTPIQSYVAPLATLCESIQAELAEKIKIGVVVTTGSCGAFSLHFDPEDIIILQVQGTKRWRIYGPPVPNPVIGIPKPPPPPETEPLFDEVLRPGDLLLVPAGNWHHCENGPDRSLHLGIFCIAPSFLHVMRALFSQCVSEEIFRIPLTRFEDGEDLADLEARAKARLIEKVQLLEVKDFLAEADKEKMSATL
jgi:ribosomal protein L16 Arg81 hydroxylase